MKKLLAVGIDTLGLTYCSSDIGRVKAQFELCGYDVASHENSKSSITQVFEEIVEDAAHVDTVVFYFSGHAVIEKGRLWLILADDSAKLSNKLDLNYMLSTLVECRAANKLVLLDCCHASAGIANIALELSNQYTLIAASDRLEKSLELDKLKASFFSYSFSEILNDFISRGGRGEALTITTLFEKLKKAAVDHNSSGNVQVPLPRLHGSRSDFSLIEEFSKSDDLNILGHLSKTVERNYRDLLLRNCDIISLANLPELDRHLATRSLELRRLYVPLRAWVDIKAGETPHIEIWDRIENRRKIMNGHRRAKFHRPHDRNRQSIGECLTQTGRLVVLGDPGSGKTTLLRWIATAYLLRLKRDPSWSELPDVSTLPDADFTPVLVRCRDLDSASLSGTLDDMLLQTLKKSENDPDKIDILLQLLRDRLRDGTAILMFDGLDEITDASHRARFCEQLDRIHLALPNAPMIITSRIVGYREMGYRFGGAFEHLTLADLEPTEKDDFAVRWCKLTELSDRANSAAQELIFDIHSSDRIERMTGNPMLLTTMALVKRKVGKLPSRRAELYSEAVQVLLNWRSDIGEALDAQEAIPQLEYIAYAMCERGTQRLRRDEMLDLIEEMRNEYPNNHQVRNRSAENFLRLLERRTGLVVEAGRERHLGFDELVYEFRHLTFQEFLAAHALVDGKYPGRIAGRPLAAKIAPLAGQTLEITIDEQEENEAGVEENWREVLRLSVAICRDDDVDDVLLAILNPLDGEQHQTIRSRAILAVLSIADEPNASSTMVEQAFLNFADQIDSRDRNMDVRTGVQIAAAAIANTRWTSLLSNILVKRFISLPSQLRDYTGDVAAILLSNSVRIRDEQFLEFPKCFTTNVNSHDPFEKIKAILGMTGVAATDELKKIPPELIATLLDLLDETPEICHAAAQLLEVISGIQSSLWSPNETELSRIAQYLKNMKTDPEAARFLIGILSAQYFSEDVELFAAWRKNENADLRDIVARALVELDNPLASTYLLEMLEDESVEVRSTVVGGLVHFDDPLIRQRLIQILHGDNENLKLVLLISISRLKSFDVEVLYPLLKEASSLLRYRAADTIGALLATQDARKVDELLDLLDNVELELELRNSLIVAIGNARDSRLLPYVKTLISDEPDVPTLLSILSAFESLRDSSVIELILPLLQHENGEVKQQAMFVAGALKVDSVVPILIEELRKATNVTREIVIRSLANFSKDRIEKPLLDLLNDTDVNVKRNVIAAIGVLGINIASDVLCDILVTSDESLTSNIITTLGMINASDKVDLVMSYLDHNALRVNVAAARTLGEFKAAESLPRLSRLMLTVDGENFATIMKAVLKIGGEEAMEIILPFLKDPIAEKRMAVIAALARQMDGIDKKLLSRDLDGMHPFWDPLDGISNETKRRASRKLKISINEIDEKYKEIFEKLGMGVDQGSLK